MNLSIEQLCLSPEATIQEALTVINKYSHYQICLVVSADKKLMGTVTDGDVRRSLLRQCDLNTRLSEVMNTSPITTALDTLLIERLELIKKKEIKQLIVVTPEGVPREVISHKDLQPTNSFAHRAVILVGGFGKRLRPLTNTTPKPMLTIQGKPILEHILLKLVSEGFQNISFAVHYKAKIIEQYFEDGSKFGCHLSYLRETHPLGTAGSLSLIESPSKSPIFVMNGDVLTKVNLNQMLDYHMSQQATATMAVQEYKTQIPFGVVETVGPTITRIQEKPTVSYSVSAGLYIIQPEVLELIPYNQYLDMPQLFDSISRTQRKTIAFPLHEYWTDIGQKETLKQAEKYYSTRERRTHSCT